MADELDINAHHVLFIVKGLAENIQSYCGYGPERVDPEVLMSMLGECAHFVARLMPAQAEEKRATG